LLAALVRSHLRLTISLLRVVVVVVVMWAVVVALVDI